jgi:tRNA pseudouridine32 synthase/23S rRNA pseudouridine746 synthase
LLTTLPAYFIPFKTKVALEDIPKYFTYPFHYTPHPLSLLAAKDVQEYLSTQAEWKHNFGLSNEQKGIVIGKMFGVLVVQTQENELGYLAAFSGKLGGSNHHSRFVPPVYDSLIEGDFVNRGMLMLTNINHEIRLLEAQKTIDSIAKISSLKIVRKEHSIALQSKIFEQYHFLNMAGEKKSLIDIFESTLGIKPSSGAGECATPKLLQYAFLNKLKPIAMAEFWWGLSPKSTTWKHAAFYPSCKEKCAPILGHMLKGMEVEEKPK